jgi:hypothetical protein
MNEWMLPDQRLRFECLKLALESAGGGSMVEPPVGIVELASKIEGYLRNGSGWSAPDGQVEIRVQIDPELGRARLSCFYGSKPQIGTGFQDVRKILERQLPQALSEMAEKYSFYGAVGSKVT